MNTITAWVQFSTGSRFTTMATVEGQTYVLAQFDRLTEAADYAAQLNGQDVVRGCDIEFGPHDHDDAECGRILDVMRDGYGDPNEWERETFNREAEEATLGRPLFPNEF